MTSPSIVWLRDDLRLADNPALTAAVERGEPVVVLFLLDDETEGIRPLGAASRWWLHHSLSALAASLGEIGGRLTLRRGPQARELPRLVDEVGAGAVFWNRRYGLAARDADADLKSSLRDRGLDVRSFQANLMFEPWTIQTGQGQGMQTLDQNLADLVRRGLITAAEARGKAKTPENFPG